jgi:preprotein translocase SecE subunit
MSSVKNNGEKGMATDEGPEDELREEKQPAHKSPETKPAPSGGGFFTIYKKGQGYWTRISTAGGVVLLLAFTTFFLLRYLPPLIPALDGSARANVLTGVVAGTILLGALFAWRLMNKPDNVDFLIATDSEMKKVNWTSQKELIGSTKVVIFFMLIIASVLFLIDVLFGYFFWLITVLKAKPF